jgi:hypothetical protein
VLGLSVVAEDLVPGFIPRADASLSSYLPWSIGTEVSATQGPGTMYREASLRSTDGQLRSHGRSSDKQDPSRWLGSRQKSPEVAHPESSGQDQDASRRGDSAPAHQELRTRPDIFPRGWQRPCTYAPLGQGPQHCWLSELLLKDLGSGRGARQESMTAETEGKDGLPRRTTGRPLHRNTLSRWVQTLMKQKEEGGGGGNGKVGRKEKQIKIKTTSE